MCSAPALGTVGCPTRVAYRVNDRILACWQDSVIYPIVSAHWPPSTGRAEADSGERRAHTLDPAWPDAPSDQGMPPSVRWRRRLSRLRVEGGLVCPWVRISRAPVCPTSYVEGVPSERDIAQVDRPCPPPDSYWQPCVL